MNYLKSCTTHTKTSYPNIILSHIIQPEQRFFVRLKTSKNVKVSVIYLFFALWVCNKPCCWFMFVLSLVMIWSRFHLPVVKTQAISFLLFNSCWIYFWVSALHIWLRWNCSGVVRWVLLKCCTTLPVEKSGIWTAASLRNDYTLGNWWN